MAKKILFVIAGPRLTGNSAEAARIVADAARSAGNEVNIVELPNLAKGGNVGCISCYGCQRSEEYKCVIHDDMGKLVASLVQYDIVAIASPVFFFSIPSQAKAFIDRFFSLTKHIDGKLQSPLSKIRLVFIASSGGNENDSGVKNVFQTIRDCAAYVEAPSPLFLYFDNCSDPRVFKADHSRTAKAAEFGRML